MAQDGKTTITLKVHGYDPEVLEVEQGATFNDVLSSSDNTESHVSYDITTVNEEGRKVNVPTDDPVEDWIHKPRQEVFAAPSDDVA